MGKIRDLQKNSTFCNKTVKNISVTSDANSISYTVTTNGTVSAIEQGFFDTLDDFVEISFNDTVTSISDSAFYGNSYLKTLTVPNSCKTIGAYVCYNCSNLSTITIPSSVTTIGHHAFNNLPKLTNLTVEGNPTLNDNAFGNCDNLKYKVTFYKDNEIYGSVKEYNVGETIDIPTTDITGYTFDGWYSESALTNKVEVANKITTANVNYYGKWTINTYTVTLEINNGSTTSTNPQTIEYGKTATWTVSASSGYTLPTSVTSGTISGTTVTSDIVKSSFTVTVVCTKKSDESIEDGTKYTLTFADGYNVTTDDIHTTHGSSPLTEVTINSGVTEISASAFDECASLSSVTINANITSIGDNAFHNCSALTNINIPNTVTTIGQKAFMSCSALTNVTIPVSVTSIGMYAFYGINIESILIPSSVITIGAGAFASCKKATSITMPDSLTNIGEGAFEYCAAVTNVAFPKNITILPEYIFNGCSSLTSITIPSTVTTINDHAFEHTGLTSITISQGITSIGKMAFHECSSLASVTISDTVTSIGINVFYGCSSLTSVTLGEGITSIPHGMFTDCTSLTTINIPNSVTTISGYAFVNCASLTTLTIPDTVTTIEDYAFCDCKALTTLTIPDTVTSIGGDAFRNIPEVVLHIGDNTPEIPDDNWGANKITKSYKVTLDETYFEGDIPGSLSQWVNENNTTTWHAVTVTNGYTLATVFTAGYVSNILSDGSCEITSCPITQSITVYPVCNPTTISLTKKQFASFNWPIATSILKVIPQDYSFMSITNNGEIIDKTSDLYSEGYTITGEEILTVTCLNDSANIGTIKFMYGDNIIQEISISCNPVELSGGTLDTGSSESSSSSSTGGGGGSVSSASNILEANPFDGDAGSNTGLYYRRTNTVDSV